MGTKIVRGYYIDDPDTNTRRVTFRKDITIPVSKEFLNDPTAKDAVHHYLRSELTRADTVSAITGDDEVVMVPERRRGRRKGETPATRINMSDLAVKGE